MTDLVSLLIEGAVAVGTVGLTILTAYQLRRDRREALARELADRVYVPMSDVAAKWQDPEAMASYPTNWSALERAVPYLTVRVPSDLRKLFEKAGAIEREISIYNRAVYDLIRSQSLGSKLQVSNTIVRIMKGKEYLGDVNMTNLWKSGKSLEQYVTDYMARSYPLSKEWSLNLWTDVDAPGGTGTIQQQVGETKEAIEYCDKLRSFLASKPEAYSYMMRYKELAEVGSKAYDLIEKQLRKRVAPQSSSPAKETGNPFG
jgi:hypothetical protein